VGVHPGHEWVGHWPTPMPLMSQGHVGHLPMVPDRDTAVLALRRRGRGVSWATSASAL
jgi:hypothetical protein